MNAVNAIIMPTILFGIILFHLKKFYYYPNKYKKLITLVTFNKIIIRLPFGGETAPLITENINRITVEDASAIDTPFASFQRRTTAIMINTAVAIPDIAIKIIGAVEFPFKSSADDKTDKIYVPMPKIASILSFIRQAPLSMPQSRSWLKAIRRSDLLDDDVLFK